MIKHLQKIGNSRGIVLDRPILELLDVPADGAFEVTAQDGGLFLRPITAKEAYKRVATKHRKSLDKLGQ